MISALVSILFQSFANISIAKLFPLCNNSTQEAMEISKERSCRNFSHRVISMVCRNKRRMKMKKTMAIVMVLLFAFAVFAGAQKESTEAVPTEPKAQNQSAINEFKSNTVNISDTNIVRGGKLVIGTNKDVSMSYVPWKSRGAFYALGGVYEFLLMFDDEGNIVPYLLESFESNPEALTYTLKVRKGVYFSDGSEFTGEVLLWNLQHFKEVANTAATHFSSVESFELVDPDTVVMHLSSWNSQIPFSLNNLAGIMYSKKAFDEHGADWCLSNPVGTGPYVVKEVVKDSYTIFVKDDNYWNKEAQPALYDEIELRIYGDNMAAQAAMLAGECDVYNAGDYGMKDRMVRQGFNLYQNKMWNRVYFLLFSSDVEGSPFCDVRVRQAVSYAINSQEMIESLDYNRTFYTNQYAVEGTGFYNPDVVGYEYNVEKAKDLMKQAGYEKGFKTKLIVGTDQQLDRYMVAIQAYLKEIGIDCELVYLDPAAWQSTAGIYGDGKTSCMVLCGHGYGSNLVQQAAANFSLQATKEGSVGMMNHSAIHPEDLDACIMAALSAKDDETMYKNMQKAEKLLIDEYAIAYPVLTAYYDQIITQPNIIDAGFCNTYNRGNDFSKLYRVNL